MWGSYLSRVRRCRQEDFQNSFLSIFKYSPFAFIGDFCSLKYLISIHRKICIWTIGYVFKKPAILWIRNLINIRFNKWILKIYGVRNILAIIERFPLFSKLTLIPSRILFHLFAHNILIYDTFLATELPSFIVLRGIRQTAIHFFENDLKIKQCVPLKICVAVLFFNCLAFEIFKIIRWIGLSKFETFRGIGSKDNNWFQKALRTNLGKLRQFSGSKKNS